MEFPPEKTKTLSPRRRIYGPCRSLGFLKVFSCTKLLDGKSLPPSNTTIMFVHSQDITLPETQILNVRTFQYLSTNSKHFTIISLEAMRPTVKCGHFKHFSFSYKCNPKQLCLNLTYLQFHYSKYANRLFKINFRKKNFSPSRHHLTIIVNLSWDK